MKTPKQPKLNLNTRGLPGNNKEAPGLYQRDRQTLQKALGLPNSGDSVDNVPQMHLASLADSHPDPAVRKAASNALDKLSFKLHGPTKY